MANLHMSTETEGNNPFEFILSEGKNIARDNITIISGQNLNAGTVLGRITASGKWTLHNPTASDGSEVARGVLGSDCDATIADKKAVGIVRLAEVKGAMLIYKAAITAPQKAAAIIALAAQMIIVR